MLLSAKSVPDRGWYVQADREVYEVLERLLIAHRYRHRDQMWRLMKLIPRIDYDFFIVDHPEVNSPVREALASGAPAKRNGEVNGYAVVHHGMHLLLALRFGNEWKNRPRTTLILEGIAGALELHFALRHIEKGGKVLEARSLRTYAENADRRGRDWRRSFNSFLEDPFRAFQDNALASSRVSNLLLANVSRAAAGQAVSFARLEQALAREPHLLFLAHKDFVNFALFAKVYCGSESDADDLRLAREAERLLRSSTSLMDLIERLGVDEFLRKKSARAASGASKAARPARPARPARKGAGAGARATSRTRASGPRKPTR